MVTQVNNETTTSDAILNVTAGAATKIKELLVAREMEDHALRVFVSGGGCSGLQYGMAIEPNTEETDTVVETDGIRLVVDNISIEYLNGANIDYIDDIMGGGFRIDNPNATSTCGCGTSFKTGSSEGAGGGGCAGCG